MLSRPAAGSCICSEGLAQEGSQEQESDKEKRERNREREREEEKA